MENSAIAAGLEVPVKTDSQSLNRWDPGSFFSSCGVRCWRELAEKVGTECFKSAYDHCMRTIKFVPDISELRWAAGIYPENPIEREAMDGLTAVIKAMRVHGPQLRGMASEHGEIAAPVFWAVAEAAIAELGFGDRAAGLEGNRQASRIGPVFGRCRIYPGAASFAPSACTGPRAPMDTDTRAARRELATCEQSQQAGTHACSDERDCSAA